jgi:RNA polymerase sigma-70 factor, ECF subfamily
MSLSTVAESVESPEGADEEFVRLLTRTQADLYVFILGLVQTRSDADDVLQEVNMALWRKRRNFQLGQDFRRWAFGFAMIEVRDFRTRSSKCPLKFSDSAIEALAADWSDHWSDVEDQREALALCLEKLGSREKQCIMAFYRAGASVPQIAEQINRPLSTVYKILARARTSLRDCVQRTVDQRRHRISPY